MRTLRIIAILWLPLITGCATRVPFTHQLRQEYSLGDTELRQIQYYVSGSITLQRDLATGEARVTPGHKITILKDSRVEEIKIRPGTPGIAEGVGPHSLDVSFEEGSRLSFGSDPKHRDSWGGKYTMFAEKWEGGRGQITYQGKTFWAIDASGNVYLMVNLRELSKFKKETLVLPGRRLR